MNMVQHDLYFLTDKIGWEGDVIETEGDERLRPIMDMTSFIQSCSPEDFDEEKLKQQFAPTIKGVIEDITGQTVDLNEILESLEVNVDGSWGTRALPANISAKTPYKRIH